MYKTNNHKITSFEEVRAAASQDIIENLENQLTEMYSIAEENFALIQKIIQFDHKLMACKTVKQVYKVVNNSFTQLFNLPHHVLKLTVQPRPSMRISDQIIISDQSLNNAIRQVNKVITGTRCIHPDLYQWFDEHILIESFLHLPLVVQDRHLGLLLVGHPNPEYFAENVPTDYVAMMATSIAITLDRILGNKMSS